MSRAVRRDDSEQRVLALPPSTFGEPDTAKRRSRPRTDAASCADYAVLLLSLPWCLVPGGAHHSEGDRRRLPIEVASRVVLVLAVVVLVLLFPICELQERLCRCVDPLPICSTAWGARDRSTSPMYLNGELRAQATDRSFRRSNSRQVGSSGCLDESLSGSPPTALRDKEPLRRWPSAGRTISRSRKAALPPERSTSPLRYRSPPRRDVL